MWRRRAGKMKFAAAAITPGRANIGQYGTFPSAKSIQSGRCLPGRPQSAARALSGAAAKAATQASRTTRSRFTTRQCVADWLAVSRIAPTIVVALLLAATAVAFAFAQRAKLEESPIESTLFQRRLLSPVCTACAPNARQAPIGFRLRNEDHVDVDVVDSDGQIVRDGLVTGRYTPRALRFSWDGKDNRGEVVADGLYRVRVSLADEGRTLEFPDEIRVDGTP